MFGFLLDYFTKEQDTSPETYNILAPPEALPQIKQEYLKNYFQYSKKRKNAVVCSHEIISPHPKDAREVTAEKLYDLAREYMRLRAPNALGFFQVHLKADGEERPHAHLLISGNEIGSSKQISLRKKEYQKVKQTLKRYTREKYPELKHAFVFQKDHQLKKEFLNEQSKRKHQEKQISIRMKKPTRTQELKETLEQGFNIAKTQKEFDQFLEKQGLVKYKRGKHHGIIDSKGKKYRLKTLGLDETYKIKQKEFIIYETRQAELEKTRELQRELARELAMEQTLEPDEFEEWLFYKEHAQNL